jgi:uncharacterized HAD superfamily protein
MMIGIQQTSKPIFGFDLDGTVFSLNLILKKFSQITGKNVLLKDMTKYSLAENFDLTDEQEYAIFSKIKDEVNLKSKPIKKMVKLIQRLSDDNCSIIIITARRESAWKETTQALRLAGIHYDKIYMGASDKTAIIKQHHINRYFDDQGALIEKMKAQDISEFCELTLIDAPYNQGCLCDSRLYV